MEALYDVLGATLESIFLFGVMFIVTLSIVVMVHEFGHYVVARIFGVHVEQFAFGFGRELFGFQKAGEYRTRFSVCMFPLGGFVKLFGDVDPDNPLVWDKENNEARRLTEEELKHSFCTKSVFQRFAIVAAGPMINILLSLFIFVGVYTTYGQTSLPLDINAINQGSAAHNAGIKVGDKIIEMDGKPIRRLNDIFDITWHEENPKEHSYTIIRDGEQITISYAAKRMVYTNRKGVDTAHGQTGMVHMKAILFKDMLSIDGVETHADVDTARDIILQNMDKDLIIGVEYKEDERDYFQLRFPASYNEHLANTEHQFFDRVLLVHPDSKFFLRLSLYEATKTALFQMKNLVVQSYKLISVAYKGKTDEPVIGGIAKISQHSAGAAKGGMYPYLMFIASFSLAIAVINILPIPALDGGYLVFLSYEAIVGKPLPSRVQDIAMIIGLVILVGIMILGNVSDLISLLSSIQSD